MSASNAARPPPILPRTWSDSSSERTELSHVTFKLVTNQAEPAVQLDANIGQSYCTRVNLDRGREREREKERGEIKHLMDG